MRFALLGPLSVHDDEGPVKVTGKLRRTLLAALLLDAGTPVSADRLAALLWGPEAAAGTSAALHTQLMRLRQALGDEDRVRAAPPGYLIHVEPGELDLHVFAEQYAAGRRRLADKAWTEASRHFGDALELWRGRPLADIPALADDLRIRELEETHLRALQGRIEAELNLGRHHEVLDELRALTEEHPRNEAFRGQLMLALYRAGQRDEAAAAYDEYEQSLLDELGLEPGLELRELHKAVLRGDAALSLPPNPNAPRQLPADTRTFTGRAAELAELLGSAAQASGPLVISALDGMAGIGKTALALHAAHRIADRFRDGQLFIDLRGYAAGGAPMPAEEALAYLLRSLGVPPQSIPSGLRDRAALYRTRLAQSRTLIVLDNAADPAQVRPLLPDAAGCLVLITSRDRLTGLDRARSLSLDILGEDEAVALLGKVAGTDKAPARSPAVRELAALCGYVPLALRIVAARLRHTAGLTVEDLVAGLRDEGARLGRLTDGERDLASVFETSYRHLPEPERRALRLLSVLPGPDIDAYAAANLLAVDLPTAEGLLSSLLGRSLLIRQVEGRYGIHDLVRAYTRSLLDAAGDQARAARDRLLDYYQHTLWTAVRLHTTAIRWRGPVPGFAGPSPEPTDMARALAWLRAERAGLLAATADPSVPAARRVDLALGLAPLMQIDGPWPEAVALQRAAEQRAEALGDLQGQADALRNRGQISEVGDFDQNERTGLIYQRARDLYRRAGSRAGEADVLFRIGRVLAQDNDLEAALEVGRAALALFREIGDRQGQTHAMLAISDTARLLGDNEAALEMCEQAAAVYRELGNRQGEATVLQHLGYVLGELGELNAAIAPLTAALEIDREYAQRQAEASVLNVLGGIHSLQGAHELADEALRRSLELFEDLGHRLGAAVVLTHLGQDRVAANESAAGIGYLERAYAGFREIGNPYSETEVLRELGWARVRAGDAAGTELIGRALEAYRGTVDDPPGEVEALVMLGCAALEAGDPRRALARFEEALPLARRIRRNVGVARALDGIARCRERLGEREAAAGPLREAVAMYRRMGLAELAEAQRRLAALEAAEPARRDRGSAIAPPSRR